MTDPDDFGNYLFAALILAVLIGLARLSYVAGYKSGVRSACAGTATVVELPDGSTIVCDVAKKEARP